MTPHRPFPPLIVALESFIRFESIRKHHKNESHSKVFLFFIVFKINKEVEAISNIKLCKIDGKSATKMLSEFSWNAPPFEYLLSFI